jgi:uncharacterized protein DUF1707
VTGMGEPDVRASDAEREAVVGRLNVAVGEGRLTLDEFSTRLGTTYAATTRGELEPIIADLPASAPAAPAPAAGRNEWHVTPLGGMRRSGAWRVPSNTTAVTLIGGADLDLRDAELDAPVVTVTKISLIGGMHVTVPPGVRVEVSGFSLIGGKRVTDAPAPAGAPTLRIRGFSLIGGIRVRSSRDRP